MSQADEQVQPAGPGKALARQAAAGDLDAWADLRPAYRWAQRRRPVLVVAVLMIAAQVAWRATLLRHLYFYRDDFFNLDFAARSSFGWHYLTYIGTGHLMILQRAVIWVLVRVSLYNWGLASAVTLAFLAGAGLAAFAALRTLFGERPAILAPLAVYLLTPLGLAALGWWTVALETIPLQLALFMALNSHIRYVRTERTRSLVSAVCWVIFGLLAFEKGLVVPVLLLAVTSAFLAGVGSWPRALGQALRRYWRAWLTYVLVLAGYLIVLILALPTATSQPLVPRAAAVAGFSWRLLKDTLVTGSIGGPWKWWTLPGHAYALAAPPPDLTWFACLVAVVVVGASVLRRRLAWRAWAVLAVWFVLADIVPVSIGRLNWYPALLALDTRYVADATGVLIVCTALAFLPVIDTDQARLASAREPGRRAPRPAARSLPGGPEHAWRVVAAGLFAIIVLGSVWSATTYRSATSGQTAARFVGHAATAAAAATRNTPVLDTALPAQLTDAANTARAVIGPIRPAAFRWIGQPRGTVDGLRIFGSDGQLYPAWVYGATSGTAPARNHGCFKVRNNEITIRFWHPSPVTSTALRIGYIWGAKSPGQIYVSYAGTVQGLSVRPGLHSAYLPVSGSATGITVTVLGGTPLCVGDVEAGRPGPHRG
ncbi:MAG TPA: hypothetical protein VF843_17470 [Streptosporangiaceae bacterium]